MNKSVIKVENLSKLYKVGAGQQGYKTLRVRLRFAVAQKEERDSKGPQRVEDCCGQCQGCPLFSSEGDWNKELDPEMGRLPNSLRVILGAGFCIKSG